jgi:predicted hydrocarbon binding protein
LDEIEVKRRTLQQTMNFAAALAYGVEHLAGRGADGMAFVAGRKLGRRFSAQAAKTRDLMEALAEIGRVLRENNCQWRYELFHKHGEPEAITAEENGRVEMTLVFRDCMIRQALFSFGHQQKGSLCAMMYGFFSGALETITGRKAVLEIIHAGENACLKRLTLAAEGTNRHE